MDIVSDDRVRRMRARGMPFREIARSKGISLTQVRAALRGADGAPIRMRREIRAEIRSAGGLSAWWGR